MRNGREDEGESECETGQERHCPRRAGPARSQIVPLTSHLPTLKPARFARTPSPPRKPIRFAHRLCLTHQTKGTNLRSQCGRSTDFTTCCPQVDDFNLVGIHFGTVVEKDI